MTRPDAARWRSFYRYWVRDPLVGARLTALHSVMRVLPTEAVSTIGSRLGRFAGPRFHPGADARARAALQILRPELVPDATALDQAVARMWHAIGSAYAEFSTEDRIWPEGRVAVEGEAHLAAAKSGGRPLIVAGLHLGNWELLPITLGYLGHRLTDVYQPQRNRFEDRIAARTRARTIRLIEAATPQAKVTLLPPSPNAGAELVRALRSGETLVMYVDEYVRGRVQAPSFGRADPGEGNLARAVRLARLLDAAIVPAYAERLAGTRVVVRFLPPVPLQRKAAREADLRSNAAALDAAVVAPVLAHLEQWFMLPDIRFNR